MPKKISHIGIAVKNIEESTAFYQDVLGMEFEGTEVVEEQKVKVAFFVVGESRIELLEPTSDDSWLMKSQIFKRAWCSSRLRVCV
jgi:methylmalonyl-CoA epimerase